MNFSIARTPRRLRKSVACLLTLLSLAATAHESEAQPETTSQWGLGIGGGAIRKPYRGVENEGLAIPLLFHESQWFSVAGTTLDLKLPGEGPLAFRLRARYDFADGYEADDSLALQGMADRKAGAWVGAAVIWRTDLAKFGAEWLGDASSRSKGQRFVLSVERGIQVASVRVTPRLQAEWVDRKYATYYYGVRADEATASRAAFEASGTLNVKVGLRMDYAFASHHGIFVDLAATRLGDEIRSSPLLERGYSASAFGGYLYRF